VMDGKSRIAADTIAHSQPSVAMPAGSSTHAPKHPAARGATDRRFPPDANR
jgi:hypothetical protein